MSFVIIMRHGQASHQSDIDQNRELTNFGCTQVHHVAEKLSARVCQQVQYVLVSPYLRTLQTWFELARYFPNVQQVERSRDVEPSGQVAVVSDYLGVLLAEYRSVFVVTHQPFVALLGHALCSKTAIHEFTPASAAVLQKQHNHYELTEFIHPHSDTTHF